MKDVYDLSNAGIWASKGYKGQEIHVVVLDDEGDSTSWMNQVKTIGTASGVFSHNTKVSLIVKRIAPLCKVTMINFIGENNNREHVLHWLKKNRRHIDLINMSFSTSHAQKDYQRVLRLGIPMICAAGNQSLKYVRYPASDSRTIAVGAFDRSTGKIKEYSNIGRKLDCVGFTDIRVKRNLSGFIHPVGGTSASAPYVTGIIAIYMSFLKSKNMYGRMNHYAIKRFLNNISIDLGSTGKDIKTGSGLIKLPKEVKLYQPY